MGDNIPAFHFWPMTEEDGAAICEWRYPEPYERFKWLPWKMMTLHRREFGDPDIRRAQYASICDGKSRLIGYAQFFPLEGVIRLGMGLRPDLCGQGYGEAFARAITDEAKRRNPAAQIDLEVEKWNVRAIRAYEKAGFRVTDEYSRAASHGDVAVYCMVYEE